MFAVSELDLERLHARARRDSQRTRYTLPAAIAGAIADAGGAPGDTRRALARRIESEVCDRLREQGYTVTRTTHTEHFDLLANGVRVECKAATWDGVRYAAAMRDNLADVMVFACVDGSTRYFVIPFDLVHGLTYLKITAHDPRDYTGRWTPYFEAWELLDELIASGRNAWQLPIW